MNTVQPIQFFINGRSVDVQEYAATRLSSVLREKLDAKDVKIGCNAGDCGACTVLVDGQAVCACLTGVAQVGGKKVDTLSGIGQTEPLMQTLQQAFLAYGAAQCGICTPGMLVSAYQLLKQNPTPNEQEVQNALGGVLCRCTGYRKIIDAVMNATSLNMNSLDTSSRTLGSVGSSVRKLDGDEKVLGADKFGDDVAPVESLVVRLIRSPYHHATFTLGNTDQYVENNEGVLLVLSARDIPGINRFGVIPNFIDQPVFAEKFARFKGEVVAAIVGEARSMETLDLSGFPVTWQRQPEILNAQDSLNRPEEQQIHDHSKGNVLCRGRVQCGDVEQGLKDAPYRVSATFTTGFIEHAYIEPEAGYATFSDNVVSVFGCTQAPYMDRGSLADILSMDAEKIRIVPTSTGGGFGSKLDLSFQPYIALAALILKSPVRITYTRKESMQSTTKRHPSRMILDIGVNAQGRVCGYSFDGIFNTGAYASWGPTVANRVPVHASGPYYIPNYLAQTTGVYTHCAPAGAFRGFGVPQAAIAQESLFDELANAIGMDRLDFRMLNALENNQPTVTGQIFESAVGIKACLKKLRQSWSLLLSDAEVFNQLSVSSGSAIRRGVGVASGWYGCGNTSLANPSTIKAGITPTGQIYLHQGAVDIGQGANTVIAQIFADSLGVPLDIISLIGADTSITPDAGKTSASRQTFVSGNAARLCGLALRSEIARQTNCTDFKISEIKGGTLTVNPAEGDSVLIQLATLEIDDGGYVISAQESYDPPTQPLDENGQGIPYAVYGYAAQIVSLDVDIQLGTIKLNKVIAAHDVGQAINPQQVEGQIHGGVAQGIGLALMEEFIPGKTDNLHDYLIPTIGDIPPIETIIVEVKDPHGPFGAKGLGEHVLIPTAPSILNAIAHASGARIRDLPATPDKVLAAIQQGREV